MTDQDFKNYMNDYNQAVQRYAADNDISPEDVVDLISVGELIIK